MKSQFVTEEQSGYEKYIGSSLRGMTADTRNGASPALLADIRIMQDFAAANPDRANTARLHAWVDKVTGTTAGKPAPGGRKPAMGSGL